MAPGTTHSEWRYWTGSFEAWLFSCGVLYLPVPTYPHDGAGGWSGGRCCEMRMCDSVRFNADLMALLKFWGECGYLVVISSWLLENLLYH
jgi:hypothetical protein